MCTLFRAQKRNATRFPGGISLLCSPENNLCPVERRSHPSRNSARCLSGVPGTNDKWHSALLECHLSLIPGCKLSPSTRPDQNRRVSLRAKPSAGVRDGFRAQNRKGALPQTSEAAPSLYNTPSQRVKVVNAKAKACGTGQGRRPSVDRSTPRSPDSNRRT
jgi:hypothetical protein